MGNTNHQQDKILQLRKQAEKLLRCKGPIKESDATGNLLELIHELQVHQAELELQNDELLRAEQENSELRRKYEDLYEFAPCGYLTISPLGTITQANNRGSELLDTTRGHLRNTTFSSFLKPGWEQGYFDAWQQAAASATGQSVELPLKRKGDPPPWVQAEIKADLDKDGEVVQFRIILVDISQRKAAEISLAEKETLLKEIHHRVKNNMQVISSLISLQATQLPEGEMRGILDEVKHRIRAMAMVHEKLYQSPNLAEIEFSGYITSLVRYLLHANQTEADVQLELDVEPVKLPVHLALPCGLVLNELFCNAYRHAFKGRERGLVRVALLNKGPDRVSLSVLDDGVGLPEGLKWNETSSLGLRLVHMLAGQLGAEVVVKSGEGTSVTITFDPKG